MPDIVSPIDGKVAFHYDRLSPAEAMQRLHTAQAAQRAWRHVPLPRRIEVCRGMLSAYAAREAEYAEQITTMMGKPVAHARGEFRGPMRERTEYLCSIAEAALADI
jgi:acyl-CoA reductase-like NAD-dependent aldehyde dehydrogenase